VVPIAYSDPAAQERAQSKSWSKSMNVLVGPSEASSEFPDALLPDAGPLNMTLSGPRHYGNAVVLCLRRVDWGYIVCSLNTRQDSDVAMRKKVTENAQEVTLLQYIPPLVL
jgi:hypothetical protein